MIKFNSYNSIALNKNWSNCFSNIRPYVLPKDIVEISNKPVLKYFNVDIFGGKNVYKPLKLDLKTPAVKHLDLINPAARKFNPLVVEYNPQNNGIIYKKEIDSVTKEIKKVPYEINILKTSDNEGEVVYYFMSKDLDKNAGYVSIMDLEILKQKKPKRFEEYKHLASDFEENGVKGKRIAVTMLKNNNEKEYSGIGLLADKMCVQYCLEKGIHPNIISDVIPGSEIAHYKRGKRFIIPPEGSSVHTSYMNTIGTANPNEYIEGLIKTTPKGEKIKLPEGLMLTAYMPEEIINKHK